MQSFILPANGKATPESIARKRKMAEAMMQTGMDISPIASPWQGGARIANALVGGLASRRADTAEAAGQQSAKDAMTKALMGGDKSALIDAASNPFMSNAGMGMIGNQWNQVNKDPMDVEHADLENQLTLAQINKLKADQALGGKPTDDISEYNFAKQQGYPGTFQEYMTEMKRAGANNMTVDMKGENAYAVDRGKSFAKRADTIDEGEQAAFKTLNSLNQMEKSIADPSFYSGFGADQLQTLKSMAVSLGADPNSVSSMESFNTVSKNAALDTMGGSLGTGFSNADRDFVVGQVPNLQNTPTGNKAIIAINRKMQERKIQIAKMARAYESKNGKIDAGFMQQLSDWAEANPLFAGQAQDVPATAQQGGTGGKTSTGVPWNVSP